MESKIEIIEEKYVKEEAIQRRLKKLVPKVFGIPMSKYQLIGVRKVYVPYYLVNYEYQMTLKGNLSSKENIHKRNVGIVVDSIEGRSYVVEAHETIALKKINVAQVDGSLIDGNFTEDQVIEKAFEYLRWRVIAKIYREIPEITKKNHLVFYRIMWEMKLFIWRKEVTKMAPTDDFVTTKESLKGLKK